MLPDELWEKILEDVDDNSVTAFACVCKQLRGVQQNSRRNLKTDLDDYSFHKEDRGPPEYEKLSEVSEDWCLWCMRYLCSTRQTEQKRRVINAAALWGHLNALKCWKGKTKEKKTILLDEQTCASAALAGRLEVLMWLRAIRCPWNKSTCEFAAYGGQFKLLKYAREHNCPWNEHTCSAAARGGHLDVLKYAHEQGCSWDWRTCEAARGVYPELLEWAKSEGCPEREEDNS